MLEVYGRQDIERQLRAAWLARDTGEVLSQADLGFLQALQAVGAGFGIDFQPEPLIVGNPAPTVTVVYAKGEA